MKQFSKQQLQQARKANLYDYLIQYHMLDFIKEGKSIHPVNNKSLSIRQGYCGYKDFATDETGNSVDFLIKYMNYNIDDAVFALCKDNECNISNNYSYTNFKSEPILENLPPQFPTPIKNNYKQLYAYLMNRGISSDTIKMLIDKKIIYQDECNNIIFANQERTWGERRGTNTYADARCIYRSNCKDFIIGEHEWCNCMNTCNNYKYSPYRGMIANSKDDGFWWFKIGDEKTEVVYVCESSIDAISLYELHRMNGCTENVVYVSIGGTSKQQAINRLKKHSNVILAVDNDDAGEKCRNRNLDLKFILPCNKDWNEDLKAKRKM